MNFADYRKLWKLARRRTRSEEDYLEFQRFQAALLIEFLKNRGVELRGRRVLDVGCGFGGYSLALVEAGGRVTALDLAVPQRLKGLPNLDFVQGDAASMPFADASFDFVLCASLIEHVPQPEELVAEIRRVLDGGGLCYLSFPPFYSPLGGHQFSPFHLLGEGLALRIFRWRASRMGGEVRPRAHPTSYADSYRNCGLYPLTIGRVRGMVERAGLELVELSTKYSPLNFARLPLLNEFLTWHAQFILRKT